MKTEKELMEALQEEFSELEGKIIRLNAFIQTDAFQTICVDEQLLLRSQRRAMEQYAHDLNERIRIHKMEKTKGVSDNVVNDYSEFEIEPCEEKDEEYNYFIEMLNGILPSVLSRVEEFVDARGLRDKMFNARIELQAPLNSRKNRAIDTDRFCVALVNLYEDSFMGLNMRPIYAASEKSWSEFIRIVREQTNSERIEL